ncbi:MAG: 3-keto-5-aminohexanoate cleavage protein [Xanthomonadales bacterium]|nr:3-keto-5-aminohexanoate cleavage protein [Xanthomonadales bacterium]NNL94903.1 3-keto-5-aminohexanoate cleavage protein [Xanthomonadales bacterium]
MCAPNGARRNHQDHAALPMTPAELATEAVKLVDARVSVLHLHVRDAQGRHSLDTGHYRDAIKAIRRAVGDQLVIQVTTESVGIYDRAQQMDLVRELRPEAVSLALGELCPDAAAESEAARFYRYLADEGIWAQHILYTPQQVRRFFELQQRGLFGEDRPWCLLVLGNYTQQRDGDLAEFERMRTAADLEKLVWSVCCFGAWEQQAALLACRRGGHVRLGFENNLLRADGSTASDNAQLVQDFTRALEGRRTPAGAVELREFLFGGY